MDLQFLRNVRQRRFKIPKIRARRRWMIYQVAKFVDPCKVHGMPHPGLPLVPESEGLGWQDAARSPASSRDGAGYEQKPQVNLNEPALRGAGFSVSVRRREA
jgi:hypothetical protein